MRYGCTPSSSTPSSPLAEWDAFYDDFEGEWTRLDTNGDGTGLTNINGDYTGAPVDFFIQAPVDKKLFITRIFVFVQDGGSLDSGGYGNGPALGVGEGILLETKTAADVALKSLTAGDEVRTNSQWQEHCHDLIRSNWGSGNEAYSARWTFTKDLFEVPLRLMPEEKLVFTARGDFGNIVKQVVNVRAVAEL